MSKSFKILGIIVLTLVILCLVAAISVFVMERSHPSLEKADAIIVLGSAREASSRERALEGLRIYNEGKAPLIILAGGQTDLATTEAAYMESVIWQKISGTSSTAASSSSPKILLEDKSLDTIQNLTNSHALAPQASSIILVSDDYHLFRSFLIAKHVGFKKVQWSSPDEAYMTFNQHLGLFWTDLLKLFNTVPYLLGK